MPRKDAYKRSVELYLQRCRRRNLSELTVQQYGYVLGKAYRILKEAGLETHPKRIGEKEISHLLRDWGKPMSITMFKIFLRSVGNDIFGEMNVVFPKTRPKRNWLTIELTQLLIATCQTPIERLLVHLELELGFRRIEVQRAKLSHFRAGEIFVHGKGRGGGKWRTIPKHDGLTDEILEDWYTARNDLTRQAWKEDEHLLIYGKGNEIHPYSPSGLNKILRRVTKRADIQATHHTLRRTFGRLVYEATGDIVLVSELLGHESIDQTRIYIGAGIPKMRTALAKMRQKVYPIPMSQTVQ